MDAFDITYFAIIALYLAGTVVYLTGAFRRSRRTKRVASWIALAGFLLHSSMLLHFIVTRPFTDLTSDYYIKLLSWSVLAIFFLLWWRLKLEFLAMTASPLALVLFVSSLTLPGTKTLMPKSLSGLFFSMHIGSIFLSLGLLAMAFGAAVVFVHLDRKIKAKEKLSGFQQDLPSLAAVDKANHWAVMIGFPLFTLGILAGFLWAKSVWGRVLTWDPKEVVSLVIWLLYGVLFNGRLTMGWRGRKPAILAIWIFVLTLVSLVGVNIFLQSHHSFVQK